MVEAAAIHPGGPTPVAGLMERLQITRGTVAPLTTVWTPPASCVAAIPTISAGTCNTESCSAYDPSSVSSNLRYYGARINYPGYTTSQSLTSTSCMPSGYVSLKYFYFTGGTNCPANWATATTAFNSVGMTIVCCPT